jgi:hypothetical protein
MHIIMYQSRYETTFQDCRDQARRILTASFRPRSVTLIGVVTPTGIKAFSSAHHCCNRDLAGRTCLAESWFQSSEAVVSSL